nr:M20/M25/M40 family metallo-hydrolase [Propionibacteriales bacterium]
MLPPAAHDEIDRLTKSLEAELIEFRRALHRHPELGHEEHVTTASLVDRLSDAGLEPRVLSRGTGVICDVVGTLGEPAVLGVRADIDALPLQDVKDVSYRSRRDGICHACGHDAHTAIVLGTGLVLAELRRLDLLHRSVRLIFQPAEELT